MMINEFPFEGNFVLDDEIVWSGACDIQVTTAETALIAQQSDYTVFLPMLEGDKGYINPIRRDMLFNGILYGEELINCRVVNVKPSQLGKVTVYITREQW